MQAAESMFREPRCGEAVLAHETPCRRDAVFHHVAFLTLVTSFGFLPAPETYAVPFVSATATAQETRTSFGTPDLSGPTEKVAAVNVLDTQYLSAASSFAAAGIDPVERNANVSTSLMGIASSARSTADIVSAQARAVWSDTLTVDFDGLQERAYLMGVVRFAGGTTPPIRPLFDDGTLSFEQRVSVEGFVRLSGEGLVVSADASGRCDGLSACVAFDRDMTLRDVPMPPALVPFRLELNRGQARELNLEMTSELDLRATPGESLFGLSNQFSVWSNYTASIAPESFRLVDDEGHVLSGAFLSSASGFRYTPAVPEPSTVWLGSVGGLLLVMAVRRRGRR